MNERRTSSLVNPRGGRRLDSLAKPREGGGEEAPGLVKEERGGSPAFAPWPGLGPSGAEPVPSHTGQHVNFSFPLCHLGGAAAILVILIPPLLPSQPSWSVSGYPVP